MIEQKILRCMKKDGFPPHIKLTVGNTYPVLEVRRDLALIIRADDGKLLTVLHVGRGMSFEFVQNDEQVATPKSDAVNSPSHYAFFDGIEAIDIIARSMAVAEFRGYCLGNRLKYRLRAGNKDKLEQDIAKSDKYLELFDKHKSKCIDFKA